MNAEDALRHYKNGERSFCGKSFRGYDFKDQNLSGADFSYTDIRGANFTNATLEEVNFTGAKSGLQRRWIFIQLILAFLILFFFYFLPGYMGFWVSSVFEPTSIKTYYTSTPAIAVAMAIITSIVIVLWQGFTLRTLVAVAAISPIASYFAGAVGIAGAVLIFVSGAVAIVITVAGKITRTGTVLGVILVTIVGIFAVSRDSEIGSSGFVALSGAVIGILLVVTLSSCISWRALSGDFKFSIILNLAIFFGVLGGTNFKNANLTKAIFTKAKVKSSNFSGANLTHVCWKDAEGLSHAELGDSILSNIKVRELLITHNGYKKDYVGCNLRGANLAGANFNYSNLKRADLGGAVLRQTNLEHTNLTEAQAIGTDFTGASLTGACLEAWNIDSTTVLKNIDCGYVFLLEQPNANGNRERRPHNPDKHFQPGDFEKFFRDVLDTVQILIRGGVNPDAFQTAFQKIMQEHQIAPDALTGIEKRGEDVMLTIRVPEGGDKSCVEQTWDSAYLARLEVSRTTALLEAEKRRADDLKEIHLTTVNSLNNLLSNFTIHNSIMSNSNNPNISITAGGSVGAVGGGDVSNSGVMNLGTISGNLTNAINQLPDVPETEELNFKELLIQLQHAIESDADLLDTDKTDLLEQVQGLIEAKQSEEPAKKEGLVRKASKMFEATLKSLPGTAKIVEACSKLLPMIFKALGFPG